VGNFRREDVYTCADVRELESAILASGITSSMSQRPATRGYSSSSSYSSSIGEWMRFGG